MSESRMTLRKGEFSEPDEVGPSPGVATSNQPNELLMPAEGAAPQQSQRVQFITKDEGPLASTSRETR
jgi:hypothetical protein